MQTEATALEGKLYRTLVGEKGKEIPLLSRLETAAQSPRRTRREVGERAAADGWAPAVSGPWRGKRVSAHAAWPLDLSRAESGSGPG